MVLLDRRAWGCYRGPVQGLPEVLLLDLDDTILRFSSGQPDAWREALAGFSMPSSGVVLDDCLIAIAQATSEFWQAPARAFWGRQNMVEARRIVATEALTPLGYTEHQAAMIGEVMTWAKERNMRPFEGALETLKTLRARQHRLALLTNGSSEFQRKKLERFELTDYFELVLIEGELGYGKPDPRVFQRALAAFGINAAETIMVGDNLDADIAGAQAVGIPGVWNDCDERGLEACKQVAPVGRITELRQLLSWPTL